MGQEEERGWWCPYHEEEHPQSQECPAGFWACPHHGEDGIRGQDCQGCREHWGMAPQPMDHSVEFCDDPNCRSCGPEPTYEQWVAEQIGPRKVGGRYRTRNGYEYDVLAIDPGPRPSTQWPVWQITIIGTEDGATRSHCTAWDERDQVVKEPGEVVLDWPAAGYRAAGAAAAEALEPGGRTR
ncbi:hypothetical protein F7Q99_39010 [Streptomyces kaniharaensis]|uniref:Uncharacterized protein n=1 Tax=Streptomyces kaniharaensis TaxID=212423 RepID=A0A6N7L6Z1_9ACTN|nr:hypothetical protein [Streptomyces kaniharaensis]MQS18023.1 hypothetical protein [Streptomyces kaniharaensis]